MSFKVMRVKAKIPLEPFDLNIQLDEQHLLFLQLIQYSKGFRAGMSLKDKSDKKLVITTLKVKSKSTITCVGQLQQGELLNMHDLPL